jgi:hypothetical protein
MIKFNKKGLLRVEALVEDVVVLHVAIRWLLFLRRLTATLAIVDVPLAWAGVISVLVEHDAEAEAARTLCHLLLLLPLGPGKGKLWRT